MKKLFANFLLKEVDKEIDFEETSDYLRIKCNAATFNVYNENAQNWLPRSFDECLREFYGDKLNVVCGIEHKYDGLPIAVFESIKTDGEKMQTTLRIPKSIQFNVDYTIPAIKEGILQGLSTEGWFEDYSFTDNGIEVKKGFLAKIDLVSIPADGQARFRNTKIEIEEPIQEPFNFNLL